MHAAPRWAILCVMEPVIDDGAVGTDGSGGTVGDARHLRETIEVLRTQLEDSQMNTAASVQAAAQRASE